MSPSLGWSVVATLAVATLVQSSLPPYRLPGDVVPRHYTLSILTDTDKFVFSGSAVIEIECKSETSSVKIHSVELELKDVFIEKSSDKEKISVSKIDYDKDNEFAIFQLEKPLEKGCDYILHIPFSGKVSDNLIGYYRSSYVDKETKATKWIISTDFEPTDARRAFPCFDEPAMKANFTIKLGHKPNLEAISNMPIASSHKEGDIVWDEFQESVPMSTYLVAYAVSEFKYKESEPEPNNVRFRVWARSESLDEVAFASKYGPKFLSYYEEFFDIPYPLPKQDLVVIPNFQSGAMENWGMITFRENAILVDAKNPSQATKFYSATVVAHELAHQWFGNLVTMKWWTDLWLNEGFATYIASIALRKQFPEWKSFNIDVTWNLMSVFSLDSLKSSHPVSPPTAEPNSIFQYFDTISYKKGGLLLHMMNSFLGEDVFRAGVSEYLKKLKYKNSVQDDLWASLTAAANGKNLLPEGVTVKDVMDKWTLQTGYPVLNVKREGGTIKVSQERFLALQPKSGEKKEGSWWVPVTFSTACDPNFENTISTNWLSCDDSEITIDTGASSNDWIIVNNKASGVYRVNYDKTTWDLIADTLHGPKASAIDEMNRFLLVSDAMALAGADKLDYSTAIKVLSYIQQETAYIPWRAAADALTGLETKLLRTEKKEVFKKFVQTVFSDIYEKYSDLTTLPEEFGEVRLKLVVVYWSCTYDIGHCVQDAVKLFKDWMTTGTNNIIKDIRSTVYCIAVQQGGEAEWNFIWEQFQKETNAAERERMMSALACTKQEALLKKYLECGLEESKIKKQDASYVFYDVVYYTQLGFDMGLQYLKDNMQKIHDYFAPNTDRIGIYFSVLLKRMVYREELDQMKKFIAENKKLLTKCELQINQGIEAAETNLLWMESFYEDVCSALEDYK